MIQKKTKFFSCWVLCLQTPIGLRRQRQTLDSLFQKLLSALFVLQIRFSVSKIVCTFNTSAKNKYSRYEDWLTLKIVPCRKTHYLQRTTLGLFETTQLCFICVGTAKWLLGAPFVKLAPLCLKPQVTPLLTSQNSKAL